MQTLKTIILSLAAAVSLVACGLVVLDSTAARMDAYEQAHNCKYDYNGFCYTESERPQLFNN